MEDAVTEQEITVEKECLLKNLYNLCRTRDLKEESLIIWDVCEATLRGSKEEGIKRAEKRIVVWGLERKEKKKEKKDVMKEEGISLTLTLFVPEISCLFFLWSRVLSL